jgi:hypothetical protein
MEINRFNRFQKEIVYFNYLKKLKGFEEGKDKSPKIIYNPIGFLCYMSDLELKITDRKPMLNELSSIIFFINRNR